MTNIYGAWLITALAGVLIVGAGRLWWTNSRHRRQARLQQQPLQAATRATLLRRLRCYARLPDRLRNALDGSVNVFLDEKQFVGCGGFEITDEVRITIAGHACLLLLNRPGAVFPGVRSVLVYPGAFVARGVRHEDWLEHEIAELRAGEAWDGGPVVLAWDEIEADLVDPHRGAHDVILHEFAHQLDDENDSGPGLPPLARPEAIETWARVMGREYKALQQAAAHHRHSWLDPYGAESPAEFFAVATESFFTDPAGLRAHHPELYSTLQACYPVDPASWPA